MKQDKNALSRRAFLGLGGAAAATVAAASLTACGAPAPSNNNSGGGGGSSTPPPTTDYKAKPPAITDAEIVETLEADVVVIGGGVAGSFAAATAAEEGASVIVLQKADVAVANGSGAAAWNSKALQDLGGDFDPWEAAIAWTRQGENRADIDLLKTWIYNSGPTMDWAMALTNDVEGVGPVFVGGNIGFDYPDFFNYCYPTVHAWMGQMGPLSQWMLDYAESKGAQVLYSTPAKQIVRGGAANGTSGKVDGVVGQKEDGSYVRVNAKNAVILAAGDYGNNPDMRKEYLPHAEGLGCAYNRPDINTGDGQLMGIWIGGKMQLAPHCSNIHYDPPIGVPDVPGSGEPWLYVNKLGKRFCNEDMQYGQLYAQDMNQPGLMHYQIFDDNFRTDWEDMGSGMMKKEPPMPIPEGTDQAVAEGKAFKADTLEELASMIGVPADALVATVERYNKICDNGKDIDYGKQPGRLKHVRQAPYYAVARQAGVLCTLNGIITNGDYLALDENHEVIEGLYCVGNCQGNFFGGLEHQMIIPGMSLGRAMTTGRVAGLLAAGKEIDRGPQL
jgi:fumarate reductase flavoprotein subunit